LSEQLRQAARQDGRGVRQLARAAGMHPGNLSRFLNGRVGLQMAALDRLADVLGVSLTRGNGKKA